MQVLSEATAWRQEAGQEWMAPTTTELLLQEGVQWVRILTRRDFSREVESERAAVARQGVNPISA